VTLIGSNCPASRVGRCVDCEGGRTAQVFIDCAITKYVLILVVVVTANIINVINVVLFNCLLLA